MARWTGGGRPWRLTGAVVAVLVAAFGTAVPYRSAEGAAEPVVAVVDFYATASVDGALGVVPERFAADDLSAALGRTGAGQMTVLSRADVSKAESALRWRGEDVLSFARLGELAQRLYADRLVVGWITLFAFGPAGSSPGPRGQYLGTVNLVVQIFDAAQGRLVWQTNGTALGEGIILSLVMQDVLHRAIAPTVAPALAVLTAGGI